MPNEVRLPSVEQWCERNLGLVSLLAQVNANGPLPHGIRLVADPSANALRVLGKLCEAGPEGIAASVVDWAGGFALLLTMTGGVTVSTMPVPAETAMDIGLRAIASEMMSEGMPAPLHEFMPGGAFHNPSFHPLLIPSWQFHEKSTREMFLAARASIDAGATRNAPPSMIADAKMDGMDIFDVRIGAKVLDMLAKKLKEDPSDYSPVLLERTDISGKKFALLADGYPRGDDTYTWMVGPEGGLVQDRWPKQLAKVAPSLEFIVSGHNSRISPAPEFVVSGSNSRQTVN